MKLALNLLLCFGLCNVMAQVPGSAEDEAVKKQERVEKLHVELEGWRTKRDSIVVVRWKEKQQQVDAATAADEKWQDLQSQLDKELNHQQQLTDELRQTKAETQGLQQQSEAARQKYEQLANQENRIEEFRSSQKGIPENPEAISQLNQTRDKIETFRNQPDRAFATLVDYGISQAESGEKLSVTLKSGLSGLGGILPSRGYELHLGQAFAARVDEHFLNASILAPHAERDQSVMQWSEVRDSTLRFQLNTAFRAISNADSAVTVLLPVDILLSPKTAQAQKLAPVQNHGWSWLVQKIKEGGLFAYLILILGGIGILLTIERLWVWFYHRQFSKKKMENFFELCDKDQLGTAGEMSSQFRGVWRRLAFEVLQSKEAGHTREEVEQKVEEAFLQEFPKLEKGVHTLSVFAAVAPLLGLLGTVFGMIELFEAISSEQGDNARRMAEGISEALINTELGLAVAIPIQLLHNFVSNRIDGVIAQVQAHTLKLVNILWHRS